VTNSRKAFFVYWVPLVIWLGVIFAESMSRYAASDETGRLILPALHWLFPRLSFAQLDELHGLIRKTGHFAGYGLLSYFFFRAWRGTYHLRTRTLEALTSAYRQPKAVIFSDNWRANWALLAMLCTSLIATCDEMHQMILPDRTGSWWDVLLDTIGGLIFQIAIFLYWKWRVRARREVPDRVEA
jgi:VanZ family protein